MNDRYLYRAKRTDNGEWVEGFLVELGKESFSDEIRFGIAEKAIPILGKTVFNLKIDEINPSTICQCTGLKKFYEKDIVKRIDIHKVGDPSIGIIEYDVENTAFVIHWIDKQKYSPMYPWKDKIEVIGNIFDNPELLEVGK